MAQASCTPERSWRAVSHRGFAKQVLTENLFVKQREAHSAFGMTAECIAPHAAVRPESDPIKIGDEIGITIKLISGSCDSPGAEAGSGTVNSIPNQQM
jgi:hypothetical protein